MSSLRSPDKRRVYPMSLPLNDARRECRFNAKLVGSNIWYTRVERNKQRENERDRKRGRGGRERMKEEESEESLGKIREGFLNK